MPSSRYLLHVNSRPTDVSNALWKEWYKDEHLPDLLKAGTCDRAALYEEIASPLDLHPHYPRKFLAVYQTSHEKLLETDGYKGVRTTSELFDKESARSDQIQRNGDFDARYYTLIQDYDPKGTGEKVSPQILTAYMNPEDPDDLDKWYREEHLDHLAQIPGYRRSLRYKLSPTQTPQTKGSGPEEVQPYLAIHEVENVSAFGSREAKVGSESPWTAKHIRESHPVIVRAWKLISAEGY